jgi:integrase
MSIFLHNSGKFYFRQHIPLDLRAYFGDRQDIAQSLKTRDKSVALTLAAGLQQKYGVVFSLMRSGIVVPALVDTLLDTTRLRPPKATHKKASPASPVSGNRLSSLFDLYIAEHKVSWKPKTLGEYNGQMALITLVVGDVDIKSIDRPACVRCRDMLRMIPPGYTKKPALKGLSAEELVKVESPGLAIKTVNIHMQLLSAVFKWSVKFNYMKMNPAEGLTLTQTRRPDEERKPYDLEDLQQIIKYLPLSSGRFLVSGSSWVPLVALYSGMRLEEICQLVPADVHEVDGIPLFDLLNKDLKTVSSPRLVPVHPVLVDLGLLEYVKTVPVSCNLWGLKVYRGNFGKLYGKQYGNWLRKHITKDALKVFHSFRHNVADALKLAEVREPLAKQVMGHSNGDITTGRYGSKYPPSAVLEAVKQITYDIDLSRLQN